MHTQVENTNPLTPQNIMKNFLAISEFYQVNENLEKLKENLRREGFSDSVLESRKSLLKALNGNNSNLGNVLIIGEYIKGLEKKEGILSELKVAGFWEDILIKNQSMLTEILTCKHCIKAIS